MNAAAEAVETIARADEAMFGPTPASVFDYQGGPVRTKTLTLVIQRATYDNDMPFAHRVAAALREYAQDLVDGHALRGVFERHTCGGCRIDAVQSIPPIAGKEMREDFASLDGVDNLRQRLEDARQHADYLPGGASCSDVSLKILGITPEVAAIEVRNKIDEALAALPGGDE